MIKANDPKILEFEYLSAISILPPDWSGIYCKPENMLDEILLFLKVKLLLVIV